MKWTVLLGDNEFRDSFGLVKVDGKPVFKLAERSGDQNLIVHFDLRGPNGQRIATIYRSNVVQCATGYRRVNEKKRSFVEELATGRKVALVEEISDNVIRITGDFYAGGHHIVIEDELRVGNASFRGCSFVNCPNGIEISAAGLSI